jgi:hypothetical protein
MGMTRVPNMIRSVIDVFTGQENIRLTRGGMAHINGSKIKIAGSSPEVGLKLVQQLDGNVWDIPVSLSASTTRHASVLFFRSICPPASMMHLPS